MGTHPRDRYTHLIRATLADACGHRTPSADESVPTMEWTLGILPVALQSPLDPREAGRAARALTLACDDHARFIDSAGHRRPVYNPLARYARRVLLSSIDPDTRSCASESVAPVLGRLEASRGADIGCRLFDALLAPHESALFDQLVAQQQPDGTFLSRTASDNPEPWWYVEAVILHALASHAMRTKSPEALRAVHRAADYHVREIQPDHASQQPWAIHAFLLHDASALLADHMLHASGVQSPRAMDAVSLLLLADALMSLDRIVPERQILP